MKKMIGILLILCLLCGSLPMASAAGGIVIDGTWSVLLPEAPTAYEAYAAETLRRGLTDGLHFTRGRSPRISPKAPAFDFTAAGAAISLLFFRSIQSFFRHIFAVHFP